MKLFAKRSADAASHQPKNIPAASSLDIPTVLTEDQVATISGGIIFVGGHTIEAGNAKGSLEVYGGTL